LNTSGFIFLISSNISSENFDGNNASPSVKLSLLQSDKSNSISSSITAGRLTISQSSQILSAIFSCKYQQRSLSCNLCIIIIIESFFGLFSLDVTVFSYHSLIQILLISETTSSGFSGSSIMKVDAQTPVIDPQEPVE